MVGCFGCRFQKREREMRVLCRGGQRVVVLGWRRQVWRREREREMVVS